MKSVHPFTSVKVVKKTYMPYILIYSDMAQDNNWRCRAMLEYKTDMSDTLATILKVDDDDYVTITSEFEIEMRARNPLSLLHVIDDVLKNIREAESVYQEVASSDENN